MIQKELKFLKGKKFLKLNDFVEDKNANSESYFYKGKNFPLVNKKLLECLKNISNFTKKSVRINLHNNPNSKKHNMIILHRMNSNLNIHSHEREGETVQMIEGKVKINFYKQNFKITKKIYLDNKDNIVLSIPKKMYHNYEILSRVAIFHEFSIGPFIRKHTKVVI